MSATIHFYIRSERPHADNSVQIYLIFSLNRSLKTKISLHKNIPIKKEFAHLNNEEIASLQTNLRNDLYCWDANKERATPQAPNYERVNQFFDSEKKRANDIILKYDLMNKPITLEAFRQQFCKPTGNKLFNEYFIEEFDNRRSSKWSAETIKSYKSIVSKIQEFKPSLCLNDISPKFLTEYENYMLKPTADGGCGNCERTVGNNMKVLKTLLYIAIKNGDYVIENTPFKNYKIKNTSKELTTRDYLEPLELAVLEKMYENHEKLSKPINKMSSEEWIERGRAKQLTPGEYKALKRFLFSCYTGLRFKDVLALNKDKHLFMKEIDLNNFSNKQSKWYLEIEMHKTKNVVVIPLIDKALKLIDVYKSGSILESITNQQVNSHLKSIQEKSGINKHLTFHVARHSFATICFLYGIDERIGQRLLGHKNRKFTEIYTHLSHNKIFSEMDKFNTGMNENNLELKQKVLNENKVNEFLPMLNNLSGEKLEQLKSLIKLLGT
jgi:integrase